MSAKSVFVLADGRRSSDCFVILAVSAVLQFQNIKMKVLIVL
jgi:hypothetical protein